VYDVSSSSSTSASSSDATSKPPLFQTYWKRYSLSPPTLINVLPDISNAAAAAFDPVSRSIFMIGTCDQNSTSDGRCSYVLNPSDDFPRLTLKGKVVLNSEHILEHSNFSRSALHDRPDSEDTNFFAMMGGLGKLSDDGDAAAAFADDAAARSRTRASTS
jgi:hypothetical protein